MVYHLQIGFLFCQSIRNLHKLQELKYQNSPLCNLHSPHCNLRQNPLTKPVLVGDGPLSSAALSLWYSCPECLKATLLCPLQIWSSWPFIRRFKYQSACPCVKLSLSKTLTGTLLLVAWPLCMVIFINSQQSWIICFTVFGSNISSSCLRGFQISVDKPHENTVAFSRNYLVSFGIACSQVQT